MAELLHRHVQPLRMTLDTAQQLVDAAPDALLPAGWIQAVVAQTLARWSETRLVFVPGGASELLFRAETSVTPAAGLVELPRLIGIDVRSTLGAAMTRIGSDAVDVRGLLGRYADVLSELSVSPTDSIVFDVSLDCASLEGAHGQAIRQCTLRWDVCLHAEDVDVSQVSSQCAAWHDRAAQEDPATTPFERN
jgi:hypothetical protein